MNFIVVLFLPFYLASTVNKNAFYRWKVISRGGAEVDPAARGQGDVWLPGEGAGGAPCSGSAGSLRGPPLVATGGPPDSWTYLKVGRLQVLRKALELYPNQSARPGPTSVGQTSWS